MSTNPPSPRPPDQPAPSNGRQPGQTPPVNPLRTWRFWLSFAALLAANIVIANILFSLQQPSQVKLSYTSFIQQVNNDNVKSVSPTGDSIMGETKKPVADSSDSKQTSTRFVTQRPTYANDNLYGLLVKHNVVQTANPPNPAPPFWLEALFSFGPTLLLILGFLWLSRRMAGGGNVLGSFGQSRARLYDAERPQTTFDDVAGVEEAENELVEIVDFLREPAKYGRLGGTAPKGVLLSGSPGTGKTLLARAVAGEAKVPFFSISASEFVEAIVGVGASRVRDLFTKARQAAPAIVFIDELDAIGRSRSASVRLGGTDEQEQTLNQILTEMDGFDSREGVIVLAATNRPDVLDPALLRPGRFDRRVMVLPPDRRGRAEILRIHTRKVPLDKDVDLDQVAGDTAGMVGADLRNVVNEAALIAARKGREQVGADDFTEAIEKTLLGSERSIVLSPADRERVAYHESGHALLGLLVPGADPVRKVTIVPRGQALGVTVQSPVDDRVNYAEDYLRARIVGALGGRAAEQLVYDVVSTGAENDLAHVTQIAQQMVVRWGMSPRVGPLNYTDDGTPQSAIPQRPYSEATALIIDEEVRRIVEECQERAAALLRDHRPRLDALAKALLAEDSLGEQEIIKVTGVTPEVVKATVAAYSSR
jgi:cell division protease FtsH